MLKCSWLPHSRMELDSTSGDWEPLCNGLIGHPEGPVLEDQAESVRLLLEGALGASGKTLPQAQRTSSARLAPKAHWVKGTERCGHQVEEATLRAPLSFQEREGQVMPGHGSQTAVPLLSKEVTVSTEPQEAEG